LTGTTADPAVRPMTNPKVGGTTYRVDGGRAHVSDDAGERRKLRPDTPAKAGTLFMDTSVAGEDVTVSDVIGQLRGVIAAVKNGDFLEAGDKASDFLKTCVSIFRDQFRPRAQFADDESFKAHQGQWREFDTTAKEWDGVKDGAIEKLPMMMMNPDGARYGAASGAMAPMGRPAPAAGRNIGTWVTMLELVSKLVGELRILKT